MRVTSSGGSDSSRTLSDMTEDDGTYFCQRCGALTGEFHWCLDLRVRGILMEPTTGPFAEDK